MLVGAICGTKEERDAALRYIFHQLEWKKTVTHFVTRHGGDVHDAEDVFQEAIIHLDRNIRNNCFERKSSLQTYFTAIAKRCWWKMLERRRPVETFTAQHECKFYETPEIKILSEEKKLYLGKAMTRIGPRCKEILRLYQLDYSMEEIAQAFDLSSPDMAKKEAYRCRVRLRTFFEHNRGWKALVN